MKTLSMVVALSVLLLGASPAWATVQTFNIGMIGDLEVPGPGDPDGFAKGTLTIDDATGDISWNFNYSNIDAPTAMHIHGPNGSIGMQAGVFVGLGVATTGGPGTLISMTTTTPANAAAVLANPSDFYVNIHNAAFGSGAVRGQVASTVPTLTEWGLIILTLLLVTTGMFLFRKSRQPAPALA